MCPVNITRVLAVLVLLFAGGVSAHDDADWIMRGPSGWCCGPEDCFEIEQVNIKHMVKNGMGIYVVTWRGKDYEVPERDAKRSERPKPWVCEYPDGSVRCLFVLPMGS